ncbi:hypothetical protein K2173_016176 [Erythroxylum novogranatense]|uniref:Uncharacterized protein n=1 Tax=Erythroxylum novogranatense TaxID=1862640 RepID=A0AAV8SG37_9ROSI|nr:hypothetical protein K2173_016176 [Erythroxylum novogranatense]
MATRKESSSGLRDLHMLTQLSIHSLPYHFLHTAICLLTDKFIMPEISTFTSLFFIALFLSIFATAHLFAVGQDLLKVLAGIDTNFTVTSKATDDEDFGELYAFKWTTLLIPPTTILIINLVEVVAGISDAINNGYQSWGPLFGKFFFVFSVIVRL